MSTELVLHNRAVLDLRGSQNHASAAILLTIAVVAVMIWLLADSLSRLDWSTVGEQLSKSMRENWWRWVELPVLCVALVFHFAYLHFSSRRERLILSDIGIRYVSPLPAALQFLNPSWSLQWNQVRRAKVESSKIMPGPANITLVLDAISVKRSVRPYIWVDPATYKPMPRQMVLGRMGRTIEKMTVEAMNSPVLQFVKKINLKLELPAQSALGPFALEKNRTSLVLVVLFFASLVYAFFDTFIFGSETYAGAPFYGVFVVGGVAYGMLSIFLMQRAEVPLAESIMVAVLAGGAFAAAMYPGLLRINQLTDTAGLIAQDYRMVKPVHFIPAVQGLPELDFPGRYNVLWSRYAFGHMEKFELRHGGLGFYQIDMAPIDQRLRDYYEARDKET